MATTAVPDILPETSLLTPRFIGIVRGEIFKLTRQRTTWITLGLVALFTALSWLSSTGNERAKALLQTDPLTFHLEWMEVSFSVLRVFSGFALILLTARIIGLDYQQGTIRIILARGVDRLKLLGAKLVTAGLVALVILVGGIVLNAIFALIVVGSLAGSLSTFSALSGTFWSDTWLYLVSVVISMVATILLAALLTVLGRSLTFGLAVGLIFFPADNISSFILSRVAENTGNDFWNQITAYLLGPALNFLPAILLPHPLATTTTPQGPITAPQYAFSIGTPPSSVYGAGHFLVLIGLYAVACLVIAGLLFWRRDVME